MRPTIPVAISATAAGSGVVVTSSLTSVKAGVLMPFGSPMLMHSVLTTAQPVRFPVNDYVVPPMVTPLWFGVHESVPDPPFQPSAPEIEPEPDVGPFCEIVRTKFEAPLMLLPSHGPR